MAPCWRTTRAPAAAALALALGAACNQSGRTAKPTTTTSAPLEATTVATDPPSTTSTTLTEEQEVEKAYLHYWDVLTQVVRSLDTSSLPEVLDGSALTTSQEQLAELRRDNTPVRNVVEHHYKIVVLNSEEATVEDRYLNHAVLLNGSTGLPKEADPNEFLNDSFTMHRMEGVWKVTFIRRRS